MTTLLYGLAALLIALIPTRAALIAYAGIVPLSGLVVLRAVFATAAGVAIAFALFIWRGAPIRVVTIAIAAGTGLFGFYPLARYLLPSEFPAVMARPFAICYFAACVFSTIAIARSRLSPQSPVFPGLNIFATVLALSIVHPVWVGYRASVPLAVSQELRALPKPEQAAEPDVYHLILDGFGRPDVLRDRYGLDLSDIVESLTHRGFDIADHGTANYVQTSLSTASMLNIAYLDPSIDSSATSRQPMYELIQRSPVIEAFKRLGYEFHFVGSIYSAMRSHRLADTCDCSYPLIGEFESTLLKGTPWVDIGFAGWDYRPHRKKIHHSFAALEALPPASRARVVIAHFLSPHPPFVFDAEGNDTAPSRLFAIDDGSAFRGSWQEYRNGYRDQARYIAARLLRVVDHFDRISRQQGHEAIIIIHGDHGPRFRWDVENAAGTDPVETVPVLLAIRWPRRRPDNPPTSLVNVYRVLFSTYFNARLEALPDRAFVSSFREPYRYIEVNPAKLHGNTALIER